MQCDLFNPHCVSTGPARPAHPHAPPPPSVAGQATPFYQTTIAASHRRRQGASWAAAGTHQGPPLSSVWDGTSAVSHYLYITLLE